MFSEIVWTFEKIYINGWKHFLPRVPRTFGEKNFHQNFFSKNFFGPREKSFQTFDVLLIDKAFKTAFFLPEELCEAEQFFPSERDNYKKISDLRPWVFLDFWWKRLAGILEFNYSCPDELSEKNHFFPRFSYFHESFRTLGEKCSKLCPTLFFGRAIEKDTYLSRGTLWRKTKCFKCFRERCFFIIVYGWWSEKFAFSEKNNSLGSKNSILCVQRNVLGKNQNLCIKKLFFFCKILSGIEAKYFGLLGKLFPATLSSFRSSSAEEGFREKFLEKGVFFSLFPDLEQKIDYWKTSRWMWKLYSTCPVEFF